MKKGCSILLLIILAVTICVGTAYFIFTYIPARVAESFGTPNPALSPVQRIRYPVELFLNKRELFTPSGNSKMEQIDFDIQAGESVSSISDRLAEKQLISDASLFTHLLIYTGLDTSIQSGRFSLTSTKSPVEIAVTLSDPSEVQIPFSVLPGWRLEEIAATIQTYGLPFSGNEFLAAAENPSSIELQSPTEGATSLEGLIPPGITYINKSIQLPQFVGALLGSDQRTISNELRDGFRKQGLSEYQAIISASIIQREAIKSEEMKIIASVFFNRLQQGMKLESDPTVQYALGFDQATGSWWKNPLSRDDLSINSPYNTYLFGGLPPAPISTPSLEALQAVAFPEKTNYMFFQAKCDGSGFHNFATTYEEHLANSCQ
jgi:UPF0755 protein